MMRSKAFFQHLPIAMAVCLCIALPCSAQTLETKPAAAASPAFDSIIIRPNPNGDPSQGQWTRPGLGRFQATAVSVALLIRLAYNIDAKQIANQPGWLNSRLFDVTAKPEAGVSLAREELRPRLQDLLQQRFHLVTHRETREVPGYALVIAKHGAKLQPTKGAPFPGFRSNVNPGNLKGLNWSMTDLATYITSLIGQPVADQTGIQGRYDVSIEYAPDDAVDSNLPSLFTALQETLGLRLVSHKVPVEMLVIDSIDEAPTPN
jgi:uncharacterized protein (TIGR03435 family)